MLFMLCDVRTTADALGVTATKSPGREFSSKTSIQGPPTAKLMSGAVWLALALIPTPSFFLRRSQLTSEVPTLIRVYQKDRRQWRLDR